MKALLYSALSLLLLYTPASSFCQSGKPVVKFGLISDIQYCNCETRGSRFYRNSLAKLDSAVTGLNNEQVQFTINLGDVTDRNAADNLDTVLNILKKLNNHVYNVSGNHDYSGVKDNDWLYGKLNMPGPYYSFRKNSWRFILLNTNDVASYANVTGTSKEPELADMMEDIKKTQRKNGADYNGGVGKDQLNWLEKQLIDAKANNDNVVIFSHHPFGCEEGLTALNDREVAALVAQYACVKAFIAGHHHAGAFCYVHKIPCIVTEGMVETASSNAWGIVEIYEDRIILTGRGRTQSHEIRF